MGGGCHTNGTSVKLTILCAHSPILCDIPNQYIVLIVICELKIVLITTVRIISIYYWEKFVNILDPHFCDRTAKNVTKPNFYGIIPLNSVVYSHSDYLFAASKPSNAQISIKTRKSYLLLIYIELQVELIKLSFSDLN